MRVVQVVRHFMPKGGMEEYAWHLTKSLVTQGLQVKVVCQRCEPEIPNGVTVDILPERSRGPSWFRYQGFSIQVKKWRSHHSKAQDIVHSHEFVDEADLLTFHTTLHGFGERSLLKRMDPSWHFNQWLEKKTVLSSRLKFLTPVSNLLRCQLANTYPKLGHILSCPVPPGVIAPKFKGQRDGTGGPEALGFIGREWKRKGLELVIQIFRQLHKKNPRLRLVVAGVDSEELKPLATGLESQLDVMGWVQNKESFYQKVSMVIHPARLEAFGMVVTEALVRDIPVLVSDQVGAASEIKEGKGRVLPLTSSISEWVNAAEELLKQHRTNTTTYKRSWDQVALEYQGLYTRILAGEQASASDVG